MANTTYVANSSYASRTYMNEGDPVWDTTYYLESDDPNNPGLIALEAHFTGLESQDYANTYAVVVQ